MLFARWTPGMADPRNGGPLPIEDGSSLIIHWSSGSHKRSTNWANHINYNFGGAPTGGGPGPWPPGPPPKSGPDTNCENNNNIQNTLRTKLMLEIQVLQLAK